ncbi:MULTISPECIES: type II toxin-antitoxin system Phd/YefM family antitoxin [unclassified Sphingomonas]|jgi:prevent-host-death family protein|uniref:type II toxin-antitoxin system Phd/YefM family antitoxin n=1 Tax=unclassified Sphingomonas TaxID=196159 RepID=UPI0008332BEA|nr:MULTISPECIES: type II toxin-antitoxin system prevent-host-death family antitoxin [unclassified Sphingomonas]MCH4894545.1 type II toxin-antitoxin system prevent-host-death family antitoxin [Sphingomonas sp. SFZ2018-12]
MSEADPHKIYNVHDAKTNLSRLIDRANAGEEIIIAKAGKPYARLMPLEPERHPPRKPGRFRHLLKDVPSDIWFEPTFTDEELDGFERKLGDA